MVTAFIVSVLGVNGLTQWYKSLQTKYGDTKIHVAIAVLSIASALVVTVFGGTETFKQVMGYAGAVFTSALAMYEVVWKQLGSDGIENTAVPPAAPATPTV